VLQQLSPTKPKQQFDQPKNNVMSKHSLINLKEMFPETAEGFWAPWNEWFRRNGLLSHTTVPALNVSDDKERYKVTLAAPGLEKSDFDIDIDGNMLTISASSEKEQEEDKKKYWRREYSYSSFSRSFTMPAEVDADAIEASYDKGILTLNLPKKEKAKSTTGKKVTVK
jgi:HSP20 family protein